MAGMVLSRTLVRSVPHQIPQIADGRVRPEHIGYNAAITALLTIDWKEPPQVSETDYRQEIFDFLKEVQISFTQKEQIYRLVEKAVEANMVSVHTDCPTIERFAWQEPNHLMAPSIK